jgi:glycosyltransferase involved in cell wall biosynthesis
MMPATICFPFVGRLVGGSHISTLGLIRRLDPQRFRPLILLQDGEGAIADLFAGAGLSCEIAPATPQLEHGQPVSPAMAMRLMASVPRLARFLRQRDVRIVHCNDGRTLATWALPAKLSGARLLWHHRGSPRAAGLRLVAPLLADRVAAVSRFASPAPGWYSAAARTQVIPSPFDTVTRYDRDAARQAVLNLLSDAGPDTRVVAFSGALIDRKRPLLFVEAMAALRLLAPDRDVRGVMLGEALDDMLERVHALAAEKGMTDRLHFLGFRTPGAQWLAGCDLLMVPAIDEPFGRTLIEAMLVGTPVVATASGGNVEAIRDGLTGLLVPPEDAEALGAACLALLADPVRRDAIADASRVEAGERFGEAKHADAIMAQYAALLTDRRPTTGRAPGRERAAALGGKGY